MAAPADPPRYAPALALPAQPFRPGGGMPRPQLPLPDATPLGDADALAFRYGVDLFNMGYWWEAHEVWEGLWRARPRDTPERAALHGLILLAAAHLKAWCGTERSRLRLYDRALQRLHEAAAGLPDARYRGLDVARTARTFAAARDAAHAPVPRERLLAGVPRLWLAV